MLRKSTGLLWVYRDLRGYFSPPVYIPAEYTMRVAKSKPLTLTHPRDPKFTWNQHWYELATLSPGVLGHGRKIPTLNFDTRGGIICEIPPVPVYRTHIWCMGHSHASQQHPRIYIKCPPRKVVVCKWCRLKFINMSTADDCDDDWAEEEQKIATTPESKEDLMQPLRDVAGVLRSRPFQDNVQPDPHVYRSVFDPDRYRWKHGRKYKYEVHAAYAQKPSSSSHDDGAAHH